MRPFPVNNLESQVLVGRAGREADDGKARLVLERGEREARRLRPVNQIGIEDVELVAWGRKED